MNTQKLVLLEVQLQLLSRLSQRCGSRACLSTRCRWRLDAPSPLGQGNAGVDIHTPVHADLDPLKVRRQVANASVLTTGRPNA